MFLKNLFNKVVNRLKSDKQYKIDGVEIILPITCSNFNNLILNPPCYIGDSAWLSLRGKLIIGKGTIIGPRIKVHTSNHRYEGTMIPYDDIYEVKDVEIGENCWIGADVTIMPGVRIGEGVVIAACSCVTKDIPDFAIIGGCPARVLKYRDISNYNKLKEEGKIYLDLKNKGLTLINDEDRCVYVKRY